MERRAKITIAKTAVVVGAIPLLLWAYEYGPNPGYCGVPNENGTCTAAGCHAGTTNDPANTGSVTMSFPNGMTYTPGVTQLLTVTISDPATAQRAWGFELTPRVASNTAAMAGTLASFDTNTALMCAQPNLSIFHAVCLPGADPLGRCQQSSAPACPSDYPLQYMEHSYTGYLSTMGTGSATYQFTWTPPATNVGNITFYVAGDAGVGNPPTQVGDHVYATAYTLTPLAASPLAATLSISGTHAGNFDQGQQGATYTVTVSNGASGGATNGLITVADTIPAGLTLVSMSGTGWSCFSSTCARNDVLNPGSSYSPIAVMVNVAANATSPQVNGVSVSGGGSAPASATDSTVIDNQLVITPASLPGGMVGMPYLAIVNVTGGLGPYTWSDLPVACPQVCIQGLGCVSCTLPAGLTRTFGPTTVTISGTPTASGPFEFGFQVTDSNLATATQTYGVTVFPGQPSQIGVFRPPAPAGGALGFFTLNEAGNYVFTGPPSDITTQFGLAGDYPVAGDWDGSGVIKLGVFRCPPAGTGLCSWYLDQNNNGVWDGTIGGDVTFQFGLPGDIPVVGDWNGTGVSKVGVMRCPAVGQPGVCTWILDIDNVRTPNSSTFVIDSYGIAGDLPAVGNWAGTGGNAPVDQVGVFRSGLWILNSSGSGFWIPSDTQYSYGLPGDIPVTGDWLGASNKGIGVFRCPAGAPGSAECQWILNMSGSGVFSIKDLITSYGLVGDKPVVGFWTIP
ncbi:MAG: choice-of-anchor V domain-containing protein [Bryobacteraceae bacterium]